VVGLDIKRELVRGHLSCARAVRLPAAAAGGSVLVAAAIYLAVSGSLRGAGVAMATDLGAALGILAVFGGGAPAILRPTLAAVAIGGDIASVSVVALTSEAAARVAACLGVAGGAAAVLLPARLSPQLVGPSDWLRRRLRGPVMFVVLPLLALSTAISATAAGVADVSARPIARGVALALLAGKPAGVMAGAWIAVRTGIAQLPRGVTWRHMWGLACLTGIGLAMSLAVAGMATLGPGATTGAAVGILGASTVSAVCGGLLLYGCHPPPSAR